MIKYLLFNSIQSRIIYTQRGPLQKILPQPKVLISSTKFYDYKSIKCHSFHLSQFSLISFDPDSNFTSPN